MIIFEIKMGYFTENKTGILITALIGFIFIVVGLLSLIGFVGDSDLDYVKAEFSSFCINQNLKQAIFGVLFGLFLIYPLFKK